MSPRNVATNSRRPSHTRQNFRVFLRKPTNERLVQVIKSNQIKKIWAQRHPNVAILNRTHQFSSSRHTNSQQISHNFEKIFATYLLHFCNFPRICIEAKAYLLAHASCRRSVKKEAAAIAIFVSVVDSYRWLSSQNYKETDRDRYRDRGRGRERCLCMLCR